MTNATIWRGTPIASIASMARGRAASELEVANAIVTGSIAALMNRRSGNAEHQRNGQQHAKHENGERGVQREQQLQQAAEYANSGMSHSVGHGSAQRRAAPYT